MRSVDALLLDCHGIVLNDPFRLFLTDCARRRGVDERDFLEQWDRDLRESAWLRTIDDAMLWQALRPEHFEAGCWERELEPLYELGPAAPRLPAWKQRVPIWLLSNHRGAWLRPRLARFDLASSFEGLLISDEIGALKPSSEAFDIAHRTIGARRVLFVDNSQRNIDAANRAGMSSIFVGPQNDWISEVDRALCANHEPPVGSNGTIDRLNRSA